MATILVADDRPLNRDYIVTLLSHFGHRILEAPDGLEALKIARSERLDLMIIDIVMPNMDGGELAKQLHADPDLAAIPILFYSAAYGERQAREVAREVGAYGVIPKPSDPEVILSLVNGALGLHAPYPADSGAAFTTDWSAASALIEMCLELAAEVSPVRRFERLAHLARKFIGARYAMVGLLGEDGQAVQAFMSSGARTRAGAGSVAEDMLSPFEHVTARLHQDGILSSLMRDPHALRLSRERAGDLCRELPVRWADVQSAVVIPFAAPSTLKGWLLLADKLGAEEFTEIDERLVSTLACYGGAAYERADERLRAEEDMRKNKAMFEALFESAPDAMLASNQQGTVVHVNAQSEKMFGYSRNELLGRPIETLVADRFRGGHSTHRKRYFHDARSRPMGSGVDLYARRRDGSEFPVDIMLSPLETTDGKLVLSVVRDITLRKEHEREIIQLNRQLQARVDDLQSANQSLETFSYTISHDLRAPLRAIDGFSSILVEDYSSKLDEEARRLLHLISANCNRMGRLIEDLLSFSRVTPTEVVRGEVDMNELARSVVDELRISEPGRQIEIKLHALPAALGERSLLRQVLVNLISNAWKFTRRAAQPSIEIGSFRNANADVYFVEDNGVGFEPQFSAKLFGVFERLHTNEEFEGSGIGLALVRRIVSVHGGEVWGTGKVGEGAKFFFTLAPSPVEQVDRPVFTGKDDSHGG